MRKMDDVDKKTKCAARARLLLWVLPHWGRGRIVFAAGKRLIRTRLWILGRGRIVYAKAKAYTARPPGSTR